MMKSKLLMIVNPLLFVRITSYNVCYTKLLRGGSNIIFRDQGFHGLVLSTSNLNQIKVLDDYRLQVEAGVTIEALTTASYNFV